MSIAFIASAVHKDSLASRLNDQRKDGAFCDVLLKVSGQTLPTHSCILTACSPFFQGLICGERPTAPFLTDVPQEIELVMPGIEGPATGTGASGSGGGLEAVMDLLEYIYTGKIELKEESVDLVVQLAEVFMLDGLSSLIQTYMNESAKPAKRVPPPAKSSGTTVKHTRTRQLLMLQQRRRQQRRVFARKPAPRNTTTAAANNTASNNSVFEPEVRVLRSRKRTAAVATQPEDTSGEEEYGFSELHRNSDAKRGGGGDRKYNFHCKQCDFVSADSSAVRDHKALHPGRAYKCLSCDFTSAQGSKLIQHLLTSEGDDHPALECSVCGQSNADRAALRDHLERHDYKHKMLVCEQCDYRCRTPAQLIAHMAASHVGSDGPVDRPFACELCGRGFKSKNNMQTHLLSHERERSLACDQCPFTAGTKTSLRAHERCVHGTGAVSGPTSANMFRCTHEGCEYEVATRHDLQVHILKHVDPQPYHCTVCGQKYAQKNSLKRHVKIHNLDEYLLQCGQCEFTTTRSDKMRNHMNKLHPDSEPLEEALVGEDGEEGEDLVEMVEDDN